MFSDSALPFLRKKANLFMMSNNSEHYLKIKTKQGRDEYFSKGILSTSLYCIGMDANLAYQIATEVEKELSALNETISKRELIRIIAEKISRYDARLAKRYEIYEEGGQYKPIIILLAGVPGIGKSTLASMLSQRFEISAIIGTDMIREILRQAISPKLVPEIHCSSYEAHKFLRSHINPILRQSVIGYEEQSRHVIVGVEATIQSSLYSRENIIIEGVHLAPNILKKSLLSNPHILFLMLYLEDDKEHLRRFRARETIEEVRKAKKYINAFPEIRNIQEYLLEESAKLNIPTIETSNSEEALKKLIDILWGRILDLSKGTG